MLSKSVRAIGLALREEPGRDVCVEACSDLRRAREEVATGGGLD
jgi:hypothetical protein